MRARATLTGCLGQDRDRGQDDHDRELSHTRASQRCQTKFAAKTTTSAGHLRLAGGQARQKLNFFGELPLIELGLGRALAFTISFEPVEPIGSPRPFHSCCVATNEKLTDGQLASRTVGVHSKIFFKIRCWAAEELLSDDTFRSHSYPNFVSCVLPASQIEKRG